MKKVKILFIHHSTGGLLIRFGKIRQQLYAKAPSIEFWDHGYNLIHPILLSKLFGKFTFRTGLSDDKGRMTGEDFNIVISNNSPKEYADIFSRSPKDFTLSRILKFDTIIFKNCFPASKIETKEKLKKYKNYYAQIIKSVQRYSNNFIVFTPPPLRAETTNPEWALNARDLSDWLVSHAKGNVRVFDFYDALSDNTGSNANMLKRKYCNPIPADSHPNILANRHAGKLFVTYLVKAVQSTL